MYGLTNEEKLKFIIKTSNELGVTAYEYGQNTKISELGARNILSGESKNPRTKNLNIMLQYLESKVVGTGYKEETVLKLVKEPDDEKNYKKEDDLETIMFNRFYKKLEPELREHEEKLLTLRKDFKLLSELVMQNKNPSKEIKKDKSS